MLTHIVEPTEEGYKANDDQELVEPKSEEGHHTEDAFEEVAEEIPECVHLSLIFSAQI